MKSRLALLLAAWLIAIHPWHMRFTTEARGYGIVALMIPVSCLLAVCALNRGHWRWWIGLAMANFVLLYTWPPTLFTVLILQLCIAISFLYADSAHFSDPLFASKNSFMKSTVAFFRPPAGYGIGNTA
jgi:uncharacterized membrane protein